MQLSLAIEHFIWKHKVKPYKVMVWWWMASSKPSQARQQLGNQSNQHSKANTAFNTYSNIKYRTQLNQWTWVHIYFSGVANLGALTITYKITFLLYFEILMIDQDMRRYLCCSAVDIKTDIFTIQTVPASLPAVVLIHFDFESV